MHRKPLLSLLILGVLAGSASAQGVAVWQPAPTPGRPLVAPAPPPTPVVSSRAQLRAELAQRRATNLARFAAYRDAGQFPQNHVQPGMLNVFIDDENHICAAANLMAQDGLLALVRQTAARDNYLRLVTVQDGPLYRWMLSSGFTQAEIDMIQEPYSFIDEPEPFDPEPEPNRVEEVEVRRLQARFREIERQLIRNAERSLDQAVATLLAHRRAHGIPQLAAISAHGDALPTLAVPVDVQPVHVQPVRVRAVPAQPNPVYVSANVRDPLVWAPHMGRPTFR